MFKVVKEVRWEAAHRLLNYEGKCANIHGHSYRAIFTFKNSLQATIDLETPNKLNKDGMVIDFSILKEKIQGWIDRHWDHVLILNSLDPLIDVLLPVLLHDEYQIYLMNGNPTAENMAKHLFDTFEVAFSGITLVSVEVFEGSKSSAIYEK